MSTGPKTKWGGKRPGSGRKGFTEREKMREKLLNRAETWEKKFEIPFYDVLFAICYGKDLEGIRVKVQEKSQVAAAKVLIDATISKEGEAPEKPQDDRPRVFLPERMKDPAKEVFKSEKVAEA